MFASHLQSIEIISLKAGPIFWQRRAHLPRGVESAVVLNGDAQNDPP
jgi:hypothetical protein